MARYGLSCRAETDLMEIAAYTLETTRGEDQVVRYINDLEETCQQLGENPRLGRACDYIRPGLRRMGSGRHVVFYRIDEAGMLVSRVLHQQICCLHDSRLIELRSASTV